jgi:hypothetical protein
MREGFRRVEWSIEELENMDNFILQFYETQTKTTYKGFHKIFEVT